jgi:ferrochelatase
MRYWHPLSEETARQMKEDGINKVVLLPLYPHYSKTTTGASLIYWWMLEQENEIPRWPTTFAYEYAANPKYLKAINERIDEGLQRFPREIRSDVQLLFSAHGTPVREMKERRDPYCCLIHSTVEQVMQLREDERSFHVAFQSKVGPAEWLTPSTPDKLKELAESGVKSVLVIPVAFVSDHVETAFELDIEVRDEAEGAGIQHYEVTSGLNSHPLFIEALAEVTASQLLLPAQSPSTVSGDGAPFDRDDYPLRPLDQLPRFKAESRCTRCHQCERITEAHRWTVPSDGTPQTDIKARPAY